MLNQLKSVKEVSSPSIFFAIARVPQTQRLVVGAADAKLYEYDFAADKPAAQAFGEGHQSYVTGVAYAAGQFVSGGYDGKLIWWDAATRQAVRSIDAHAKWMRRVVSSPDGKRIASVADDMLCKLWNAESGELLHTLADHKPITPHNYPSMLFAAAFSHDGTLLATGDKVGHVAVWNVETGQKVGEVEAPGMYTWDPKQRRHSIGGVRSLAFSRDGAQLAVGGIGHIGNVDHLDGPARVELFDWRTGKSLQELADTKHKGLVEELWYSPGDQWLVTAGGDHSGFVTIYDAATRKIVFQEKSHEHIHALAVNEAGDRIYTAHYGWIVSWSLAKETEKAA